MNARKGRGTNSSLIPSEKFLLLWDSLLALEWETDHGLAVKVGIAPTNPIRWRRGETKGVQPQLVKLISQKLGYEISLKENSWVVEKPRLDTAPSTPAAPVVSSVHMIDGKASFASAETEPLPPDDQASVAGRWFKVMDDSMVPWFSPGQLVFATPEPPLNSGKFVVVVLQGNPAPLIRSIVMSDRIVLIPYNHTYQERTVDEQEIVYIATITHTKLSV